MLPLPEIPDWVQARFPLLTPHLFTAPPQEESGMPDEEVGDLPALVGRWIGGVFDGGPHMRTYWRPSEEEIEAIKNGALIELTILGNDMPAMAMNVEVE